MKSTTLVMLAVTGVVALSALAVREAEAGAMLCPHCVCPPSYSPVCGYRESTRTTRGFPSRCVLECTNKCRKTKFEFVYNGRCGKWSTVKPPVSSPEQGARTVTEPPAPPVPPVAEDDTTTYPDPETE